MGLDRSTAFFSAGTVCIAIGCGGSSENAATFRESITSGAIDAQDPAVVYVEWGVSTTVGGDGAVHWATGTVVSSHVVLTAAHFVEPGLQTGKATFLVFVAADRRSSSKLQAVREVHVHPAFKLGAMASGHDLAVLILDSPTTIVPVPINRSPIDSSWLGKPIRFVGYGVTSATDTATAVSGGQRREGASTIGRFDSVSLFSMAGGSQPCAGDSGGPGLVTVAGVEVLAGVVSYGDMSCLGASLARVDEGASFVDGWINQFDPTPDAGFVLDAAEASDGTDESQTGADATDDAAGTAGADARRADSARDQSGCSVSPSFEKPPSSFVIVMVLGTALALRRRGHRGAWRKSR